MASDDTPWHLLERFCAGTCTLEERAAIEAWCAKAPRNREFLATLEAQVAGRDVPPAASDIERAWQRLERKLDRKGQR